MRIALIIILTMASAAYSQQGATVIGRVEQEKRPESEALVNLRSRTNPSIAFNSTADAEGNFKFENVPPGDYTISSGGAASSGRAVGVSASLNLRLRAGEIGNVTLELDRFPVRESVTISAGDNQLLDHVSKSVNVITGQEMRERADFALIESLRTIPGFRVQQLGGFGRTATVKTRGLRNQDTAVLIDGIRFRDPAAITGDASPFLSDITLTSVSEVEVLRGPGSSLYGTNAIGGVIDLQTPYASMGTHGQISGAFGGLGLSRFRGNISRADGRGRFGIVTGLSRTVYSKGIDGEDDAHNTNFQTRIDSSPFLTTEFSGRVFFSDADVRLNANPDTLGTLPPANATIFDAISGVNFAPDANDPDSLQKSRFFNGRFSVSHSLGNDLNLRGYYQGLATKRTNENDILGPGFQSASTTVFDGAIHTANATVNWSPNSVHDVKVGYEFEHEKFGNDGLTPSGTGDFFTRAFQSSNTLFAQDVVSLLEGRLQVAGGFRAQFFSLSDPEFSLANAPYSNVSVDAPPAAYTFDGAASYFFASTGTKLRAHVGNGYRVPSLFERYGTFFSTFGGAQFVALGDPGLKPEKTIAFDAGIEQYFAKEKVKLTAVYFYTKLIDTIGFGFPVPNIGNTSRRFGGYRNEKGGIARGAEFSGMVKPTSSTDIFASYTFTNSDQRVPQVPGSGVIETLGIPKHQFTLVATQRIKRFWVNFDLLATSAYLAPIFSNATFNTYLFRFDGNRRADLTAGYTFPINKDRFSLRVFGTVENLFDYEYFENGFRTVPINGRVGVSFGF